MGARDVMARPWSTSIKNNSPPEGRYVHDLKEELIYGQKLAMDEDERVLVWMGEAESTSSSASGLASTPADHAERSTQVTSPPATEPEREPLSYTPQHLAEKILTSRSALEGERKQVTVLFCDLRNSTTIVEQIGAEAMQGLHLAFDR